MKKNSGWLGYIGDYPAQLLGIIINNEIRIPINFNQYFMESRVVFFFFVAQRFLDLFSKAMILSITSAHFGPLFFWNPPIGSSPVLE